MVEVLHTHDRMQADTVRRALERKGIRVHSREDDFDPYLNRYVLSVHEADAPRAIAIRRKIEEPSGADAATQRQAGRFFLMILALVIAALVFAALHSG